MPTVEFSMGNTVSMTHKKVGRETIKILSHGNNMNSNGSGIVWCCCLCNTESMLFFSFRD